MSRELDDDGDCCPICMCAMASCHSNESGFEEIALLPCQHYYHNSCVQDWTRTATSCPYCRAIFSSVTVSHYIGGPPVRQYQVEGKVQEDVDIDDDDIDGEAEAEHFLTGYGEIENSHFDASVTYACIVCGSQEHEESLMLCSACDDCYHAFCLDVDHHAGQSFVCPTCITLGNVETRSHRHVSRNRPRTVRALLEMRDNRGRTSRRRLTPLQSWTAAWARVRERAWSTLNAGLELETVPENTLTAEQEEDVKHWRLRFERRGPSTINTSSEITREKNSDRVLDARLWKLFEKASKIVDSSGKHTSSISVQSSPPPSPSHSISAIPSACDDQECLANSSAGQQQVKKQKRPSSSLRTNKEHRQAVITSNESKLTRDGLRERPACGERGGYLSSLLENIKSHRDDVQPVRVMDDLRSRTQAPSSASFTDLDSNTSIGMISRTDQEPATWSDTFPMYRESSMPGLLGPCKLHESPTKTIITKSAISALVHKRLKPFYKADLTKEEFIKINRSITKRIFKDYACRNNNTFDMSELSERVANEVTEELFYR